jgi:hypothetical protein
VGYTDNYTTCAASPWKWAQPKSFDTTATRDVDALQLRAGTTYHYIVRLGPMGGSTTRMRCGELTTTAAPTPTLPVNLANLNLVYDKAGTSNPFHRTYT